MEQTNRPNPKVVKTHNNGVDSKSWHMSKIQSILAIVWIVLSIITVIVAAISFVGDEIDINHLHTIFSAFIGAGIGLLLLGICHIVILIASFVIAILQIINGVHENNKLCWIAGILIVSRALAFIPIIGTIALIASFAGIIISMIVWAKGPHQ